MKKERKDRLRILTEDTTEGKEDEHESTSWHGTREDAHARARSMGIFIVTGALAHKNPRSNGIISLKVQLDLHEFDSLSRSRVCGPPMELGIYDAWGGMKEGRNIWSEERDNIRWAHHKLK